MCSNPLSTLIFFLRGGEKYKNGQTERAIPMTAQGGSLFDTAAKMDHPIGKAVDDAIKAIDSFLPGENVATKALNISGKVVNPLLIGAAGFRVAKADDKEKALYTEISGLAGMFGAEKLMKTEPVKEFVEKGSSKLIKNSVSFMAKNVDCFKNLEKSENKFVKIGAFVASGVAFAAASILGSTAGAEIGTNIINEKRAKNHNNPTSETKIADNDKQSTGKSLSIES